MTERAHRLQSGALAARELLLRNGSAKSDNLTAGARSHLDAALNANRLTAGGKQRSVAAELPTQRVRATDLTDWLRAAAQVHERAWR